MLIIINLSGDRYYLGRVVGVESELIARFANNKAMRCRLVWRCAIVLEVLIPSNIVVVGVSNMSPSHQGGDWPDLQ